jgi:hypothetical protein
VSEGVREWGEVGEEEGGAHVLPGTAGGVRE